jgi:hypothetical protein
MTSNFNDKVLAYGIFQHIFDIDADDTNLLSASFILPCFLNYDKYVLTTNTKDLSLLIKTAQLFNICTNDFGIKTAQVMKYGNIDYKILESTCWSYYNCEDKSLQPIKIKSAINNVLGAANIPMSQTKYKHYKVFVSYAKTDNKDIIDEIFDDSENYLSEYNVGLGTKKSSGTIIYDTYKNECHTNCGVSLIDVPGFGRIPETINIDPNKNFKVPSLIKEQVMKVYQLYKSNSILDDLEKLNDRELKNKYERFIGNI